METLILANGSAVRSDLTSPFFWLLSLSLFLFFVAVKDLRHGVGGVNFEGGELITSEWKFDQPHGFGEQQTPSGYYFMGEYKAGQPSGMGFVNYGDGTTYHGQFLEGQPHGYGIWQNGKYRYEGEFVAGVKEGRAKMINILADGAVVFTGRFKNDQPVKQ